MSRKFRMAVFTTMIVLVTSGGIVLGGQASDRRGSNSREVIESLELFGKVYEKITRNYVDQIDPTILIESAIEGMLEELDDPHSVLLAEENYDDLMISTQGEFGGLGITITVRDGYPTVISPIDDTPAIRMGIQGGDKIVEIEGESTEGWKSDQAVAKLRGPKGTEVNIGIQRVGVDKIIPFTIVRDIIHVQSVPHAFMIDDDEGVGYVRVINFSRTTATELEKALTELDDQGMRSLVLDLRFNPGGLLQAAKEVSELFLSQGQLIVYTQGRLAQQNMRFYASNKQGGKWGDRPLIVLINGSSASASEIVAGAVQDHDVGVVAGMTSFGKGSVQTVFEMSMKKALKLTTAKYYTPSGRSIHKKRSRDGEAEAGDVAETDSDPEIQEEEMFYTDMGREVLGGGGISPDLEFEPTIPSDFVIALERDATYFEYANRYAAYNDISADLEVTDKMLDDFYELAQERPRLTEFLEEAELEFSRDLFEEHEAFISQGIRREALRRAFGSTAAYKASIEFDEQLWSAVELLRQVDDREELLEVAEEMQARKLAEAAEAAELDEAAPQSN